MNIVIIAFMAAVVLVLFTGVVLMMKGGAVNTKYGNKLMLARVGLQGLAILLLGAMFVFGK